MPASSTFEEIKCKRNFITKSFSLNDFIWKYMRFGLNGLGQDNFWSPLNLKWVIEKGFERESVEQLRRFFERAKIERKEGASDVHDY